MWFLLVSLYMPIQDIGFTFRFDDFRSYNACMLAKIKLMEHQAQLLESTGKDSFITEIECRVVENG